MIIHGTGRLQHHFWGDYHATLALRFDTREMASSAIPKLVPVGFPKSWSLFPDGKPVVGIFVNSKELDTLIEHLVSLGADRDAITSHKHSIDYGEPFGVIVCVEDPAQQQLPLA